MPSPKEIEFARKMKALLQEADNLQDEAVKRVLAILARARREVAADVASTDWETYRLAGLKEAIERAMTDFADKYSVDLRSAQADLFDLGIARADIPLSTTVAMSMVPSINIKALEIAQNYSSDLISNLTEDSIKKINQELTMGILGQKTPFEVMTAIGKNLDDPSVFRSIATRAEVITRTETGRIFEMATQSRMEDAQRVVPDLMKQWMSSPIRPTARPEHHTAEVDGQIRGIDEAFDVAGEQLMFPGDPAGSAWNTINCG